MFPVLSYLPDHCVLVTCVLLVLLTYPVPDCILSSPVSCYPCLFKPCVSSVFLLVRKLLSRELMLIESCFVLLRKNLGLINKHFEYICCLPGVLLPAFGSSVLTLDRYTLSNKNHRWDKSVTEEKLARGTPGVLEGYQGFQGVPR